MDTTTARTRPQSDIRHLLATRARQQAAIASLGQRALTEHDLQALMEEVVETVSEVLEIEYCKLLELQPGGDGMLLRAGVGWREGLVGSAIIPAGLDSQAGYTLKSDAPVIVQDLRTETRFNGPALLTDHDVVSGMSCIIRTDAGVSSGVLGAHSRKERAFTADDVNFLQAVANVLAAGIQRTRAERELRTSESRLALALEAGRMGVWEWDMEEDRITWSPRLEKIHGLEVNSFAGTFEAFRGDIHPEDEADVLEGIERSLRERTPYQAQYRIVRPDGELRWLEARGRVLTDERGRTSRMVGVCTDISDRKDAEERLKQINLLLERKVAERTARLEHLSGQLRLLAAQLTDAEQRERRRIAEQIHDHLQQLMVAGRMRLASARNHASDPEIVGQIDEVLGILGETLRAARTLSIELRPPVLYEHGLPAAIRWLADWMGERHVFRCELDLDESADPGNDRIRAFLFQATRELLFNVVKHSGVPEARVVLRRLENGRIRLRVDDHGIGFDVEILDERRGTARRFGLFSIRERLKALGGGFRIESRNGQGTTVELTTPPSAPGTELEEGFEDVGYLFG